METTTIKIEGMHCMHCVSSVRDALAALPGVSSVEVDLDGGSATVSYDQNQQQRSDLQTAIFDVGFDVIA